MFIPSSHSETVHDTFCEYSVRVSYDVSRCMTQEEFSDYIKRIGDYSNGDYLIFVVICLTLLLIGLIIWITNK